MKKTRLKQVITLIAFIAVTSSFTSCNRGYGCPNNFSITETVTKVVKTTVTTAITTLVKF